MSRYTIQRLYRSSRADVAPFHENGFFFNDSEHIQQQSPHFFCTLTALNQKTQRAEARCTFFMQQDKAVSPAAAPFGSIEFAHSLPDRVLSDVVGALLDEARRAKASSLYMVNYPHCYAPEQVDRLTAQLLQHGFRIRENHLNFHLPVTNEPFEQRIVASERRRLRKCRQAGFYAGQWTNPDSHVVIQFLSETRRQKNYPLTISAERLAGLLKRFPEQFPIFAVYDGATLVALTITVRVRDDILYNFLPASHPGYQTFSPMVMLIEGLHVYARQQGIRLIDLGVALTAEQQPKPSLMRFKRNLGAQESPKLVFEKVL